MPNHMFQSSMDYRTYDAKRKEATERGILTNTNTNNNIDPYASIDQVIEATSTQSEQNKKKQQYNNLPNHYLCAIVSPNNTNEHAQILMWYANTSIGTVKHDLEKYKDRPRNWYIVNNLEAVKEMFSLKTSNQSSSSHSGTPSSVSSSSPLLSTSSTQKRKDQQEQEDEKKCMPCCTII